MALLRPKQTSIVTQGTAAQGGVKSIANQASVARRQEVYKPGVAPSSEDMVRLQQHVIEATGAVNSLPVLGGVYYPNVTFPAGAGLVFQHGITNTSAAFLIARMRTVGVSPTVFEVGQVRPVPGVTILEAFTACTCDVWFYPQPSAQGSKPVATSGVTVPTVPPAPTPIIVPPVVPVPSTGGWVTVFDLDFTAQANQTLSPDGNYTIAGKVWTKQNSANDAIAMAIVAGTGLVIHPAASTAYLNGVRSGPILQLPLTTFMTPQVGTRVRVYVSIGASEVLPTGANNYQIVGIDSGNTDLMLSMTRGFRSGLSLFNYSASAATGAATLIQFNQQPSGSYIPSVHDRTFIWESLSLGMPGIAGYYGEGIAAGAAFPGLTAYKMAGYGGSTSTTVLTALATQHFPADLVLVLSSVLAAGGSATTTPIQRVRVDINVN